jgi:hypothetical protein
MLHRRAVILTDAASGEPLHLGTTVSWEAVADGCRFCEPCLIVLDVSSGEVVRVREPYMDVLLIARGEAPAFAPEHDHELLAPVPPCC